MRENEIPVFFIKFPGIIPSYNYNFEEISPNFKQNKWPFAGIIRKKNFRIIDLGKAFMNDCSLHSYKYDFENDYHYNSHAHKVIGVELSKHIQLYLY